MKEYIKTFETEAEMTAYLNSADIDVFVGYTKDDGKVHWSNEIPVPEPTPDEPKYVVAGYNVKMTCSCDDGNGSLTVDSGEYPSIDYDEAGLFCDGVENHDVRQGSGSLSGSLNGEAVDWQDVVFNFYEDEFTDRGIKIYVVDPEAPDEYEVARIEIKDDMAFIVNNEAGAFDCPVTFSLTYEVDFEEA